MRATWGMGELKQVPRNLVSALNTSWVALVSEQSLLRYQLLETELEGLKS